MTLLQNSWKTPDISLEEVEYNLKIMANTINDEANAIDSGFVEIFQNALKNQEKNEHTTAKIGELSFTLESISNKISDQVAKKAQFEGRKFIGPVKNLKVIEQSLLDGTVKRGISKLAQTFDMSCIVKDNHCLYRATIAGYIIDKFCKMSKVEQANEIARLEALSIDLSIPLQELFNDNSHSILDEFKNVKALLVEISQNQSPENINLILNNEKSNCLIKFSRMLASGYYLKNPNPCLEEEATVFGKDLKTYLRDMATFKKEQWGGDAELIALSKTLGIHIQVTDVNKVGENGPINQPYNLFKSNNNNDPTIDVMFLQKHYNRGVKKIPIVIDENRTQLTSAKGTASSANNIAHGKPNTVRSSSKNSSGSLSGLISSAASSATSAVQNVASSVNGAVSQAASTAQTIAESVNGVLSTAQKVASSVNSAVSQATSTAQNIAASVNSAATTAQNLASSAKSMLSSYVPSGFFNT